MREKIQEQLRRIEEAENIKILLAVESGSRAWGFASPDSDYDVRFIYIRRLEDYLRLDAIRDVIELPIDDVLDINGWDLQEFEEKIKILESEIMEQMTEDEKLYYEAKDRFKEETKDIIRRYRENLYRELEKQHIEIIREEYQGRMQNCAKTEQR